MPTLPRLAVLASGRGSNLQAILDAIAGGTLDAEVVGVFGNRPQAQALQRVHASLRWSRDARAYARREDFDAELAAAVAASRPDWVRRPLASRMRSRAAARSGFWARTRSPTLASEMTTPGSA